MKIGKETAVNLENASKFIQISLFLLLIDISDEDMKEIAVFIKRNKNLTSLNLKGNELTNAGVVVL